MYAGGALLLIVAGLYAQTLSYGWAYEDMNDPERFLRPFTWATAYDQRIDRMLTGWTYGLSAWISPMEPWGYHLVSVGLHALNTLLLFWLARLIWADVWRPFVCAALFAVHPIQTETVAYISARPDLLMTTGVLVALLAVERGRWGWLGVACVLAVLAKESGIVAVPLALLWARGRRLPVPNRVLAVVGLGGVAGAAYLATWHALPGWDLTYTAQETAKLWHLLGKVIVPVGLSIDHDYGQWPAAWPMVTLVGTVALACVAITVSRPWACGWLFVLVALAPRLLVPLVEGLHEHHLATPMIGIAFAIVGSLPRGMYVEAGTAALPA